MLQQVSKEQRGEEGQAVEGAQGMNYFSNKTLLVMMENEEQELLHLLFKCIHLSEKTVCMSFLYFQSVLWGWQMDKHFGITEFENEVTV